MIGPPVPAEIERIRAIRLGRLSEEDGSILKNSAVDVDKMEENEESESSGDDFGPSLPEAQGEDKEEEEKRALERLNRASKNDNPSTGAGTDRAGWMNLALGGGSDEISYDPKTYRRINPKGMDASWKETEGDRAKRKADEMMGLNKKSKEGGKEYDMSSAAMITQNPSTAKYSGNRDVVNKARQSMNERFSKGN